MDVVDTDEIESWVSQDLLKTCTSVERVSESEYCQIGTTAIVKGDVNAVCTLECAHRRQSLAARALQERSLLIRGLPFLRTKTTGDVHIGDLVILSVFFFFCNFQTCTLIHRPSKCSEDALHDFLQMPTNAGKSGSTLSGEFWGGRLDGVSGTLGFPLERRVSVMLVTMLISAMGVNRTLLQRLLGGWAFALAFRREVFARLDVSHTFFGTSLPPSRRCRLKGALFDELLLVTGLAPLLETNFRAEPCETLYTTDESPSGTGGCSASITQECNMHDVRAAVAPFALKLKWITLFSYRFLAGKHINLLELESLISLLRRITRAGIRKKPLLVLVESRVVLGAVSTGGSSSRKFNFLLRKLWCLVHDVALELVWVPTWANPPDALFTEQADRKLVWLFAKASFYADRSAGISSRSPAHVENETSQVTHVGEGSSTPSNVRHLSRDSVENDRRDAQAEGAANFSRTSCWPAAIPSSSLRVGSVRRLGSPCLLAQDQTTGETNCCVERGDIERHPGPKRAPPSRGRDVLMQDALPTKTWPFRKSRRDSWTRKSSSATTSLTFGSQVCAH